MIASNLTVIGAAACYEDFVCVLYRQYAIIVQLYYCTTTHYSCNVWDVAPLPEPLLTFHNDRIFCRGGGEAQALASSAISNAFVCCYMYSFFIKCINEKNKIVGL